MIKILWTLILSALKGLALLFYLPLLGFGAFFVFVGMRLYRFARGEK